VAAARAVLDLPQLAGLRMKRRSLHVAMAERPDLVTHALRTGKRIVLRNRAVGIEADDLPEQTVHPLRLHAPFRDRALALRHKQRAVPVEHEPAAEMRRRSERRRLVI